MAVKTSEIADHEYAADALDNLILPGEHKSLLKALCDARKSEPLHRSARILDQDRLKTMQNSQVILLHGVPGAGKSFTVGMYNTLILEDFFSHMTECVANYHRCPLIKLTARDLASEAQVIDETLRRYFKLASSWGAILLLDEADILLARRGRSDPVGSSVVAGGYFISSFGMLIN